MEEKKNTETSSDKSPTDSTLTELQTKFDTTVKDLTRQLEEERTARITAENNVCQLNNVLKNLQVVNTEEEKSFNELADEFFQGGK